MPQTSPSLSKARQNERRPIKSLSLSKARKNRPIKSVSSKPAKAEGRQANKKPH